MSALRKVGIVLAANAAIGLCLAVPAGADPGDDPCHSIFIPICRLLPIVPDLDHDVDLTQDPNGLTTPGGQSPSTTPGAQNPGTPPGEVHHGG